MVNHIVGTVLGDTLNGTNALDLIEGLEGDDLLKAYKLGDTLDGGVGNDTLVAGSGYNVLIGGRDNDHAYGSSSYDTLDGGEGDDYLDGGSGHDVIDHGVGNDTVYAGSGDDVIDVDGQAGLDGDDAIYTDSGHDWANAGDGNDTIWGGQSGNDTLFGGANDDWISGESGNDWIAGGTDDGTFSFTGGSNVIVDFLSTLTAVLDNSFGYYLKDGIGNPTTGKVIWASLQSTSPQNFDINGVDPADVGFFLIPDGGDHNPGLSDGDDVTFAFESGRWVAKVGGVALEGLEFSAGLPTPVAYFTDTALNPDGVDHEQDNLGIEGESNWEDLFNGGDFDYDDANFDLEVEQIVQGVDGGDTLLGGSGNDTFYYLLGVDGVDTIKDFGKTGVDTLALDGGTIADVAFHSFGGGTLVEVLAGGAIFLENVSVAYVQAHTEFV